ncbi:MAG: c-type cytochrome, partial [Bythopirellula sp.]
TPLNLRIQSLRLLAHRVRSQTHRQLPDLVVASLSDPEPRIRFEAVQAIWRAEQKAAVSALINQLVHEQDRLVYYSIWRALGDIEDLDRRKQLLVDKRQRVRLAGMLSLLERHELELDDVLAIAEDEPDEDIQHWAMTWAMNPQPPKKMPNTTARIELEESVSMNDLIERARAASNGKLRRLYLSMISRATYRDDSDWDELRDFYETLSDDDERALVIIPLSRENDAQEILGEALRGNEKLRQAAVRGFASLSRRSDDSPERIADYLLSLLEKESSGSHMVGAVEALASISLPTQWRPASGWDSTFSQLFEAGEEVALRSKILTLLLAIEPDYVVEGVETKRVLERFAQEADPRLYASLTKLKPRLGMQVEMKPPEQATVAEVLAKLPNADPEQGRELFFSKSSGANCAACHRISGRGQAFAPDLSGIGVRANSEKIAKSILEPSEVITEGYHLHNFVMDYGLVVSGAVLRENNVEIQIVKSDGTLETIEKQAVEERVKSKLSAMPTGFALLGNEQVADIVAFLRTCQHGAGDPGKRDITRQLSSDANLDAIAEHLLESRTTASVTRALALHYPDLDRTDAYQIQMALLKKLEAQGEEVIGWKMGGTKITKPGQALDPIFGFMLASDKLQSGSAVDSRRFADNTPIVEAEIGFWIAHDLPGPRVSRDELAAAIAGVGGASELISVRVRDAAGGLEAGVNLSIADGLAHGGLILPKKQIPLFETSFDTELGRVAINGQLEAEGAAKQMMAGAPLDAVLSLANELPKLGRHLRTGDVVVIGSLLKSPPAAAGDRVEITFSTLEPLTIEFE